MVGCFRATVFFFVVALFLASAAVNGGGGSHRRSLLHQPFFPAEMSPPPKQPFTASPTPQKPFFPSFRSSPPPPVSATVATFPANISSVLFPKRRPPAKPISRKLVAVAVSVSLASAAVISAVAALILYHRRRRVSVPYKPSRSDSHRLFPPNAAASDKPSSHAPSSSVSSGFLYPGNSREIDGGGSSNAGGASSAYQTLDSPELKPLPPLPRNIFKRSLSSSSSDEEEKFFSPRASLGGKESPLRTGSSSRRLIGTDAYGSTSFNSRTPSYPDSKSGSRPDSISTSPSQYQNPSPRSEPSKSPDSISDHRAPTRPPPPPPEKDSGNTQNSPAIASDISSNQIRFDHVKPPPPPSPEKLSGETQNSPATAPDILSIETLFFHVKLPPPPPPLPPARFWESPAGSETVQKPISGPPAMVAPSRPVMLQSLSQISAPEARAQINGALEKPKLKPLHWDKVRASSDRAMVWDQIKSSSFQLNEEMIETLFTVNNTNSNLKESVGRQVLAAIQQENRVLDTKKSQNIAILLRALNVTIDEVCESLLEGNADTVGTELLESLLKMAPTKEEERKLKEFNDEAPLKLGLAEKFLKAVLDVPFAFKRVGAMLYIANFDSEVEYLFRSFETLEAACEELRNSRMFLKLLEAVLMAGNRMNVGTNRGDAHAFKLDTLLKLVDVKGADGKTTLLHFVVQEIIRAEGSRLSSAKTISMPESPLQDVGFRKLGLQVVAGLSGELVDVKKAAALDFDVLSSEVLKLTVGISKISEVVKLNEGMVSKECGDKFSESMEGFLKKAREEISKIQAQESVAISLVKEITEYFHGSSTREEAHPFRIFTVVRDFLAILDRACKEVGKINERSIVGATRQFQTPTYPNMAPVFPGLNRMQKDGSSDDETSSTS